MRWTEYATSMLLFSAVSMLLLYLIQRVQGILPWNPQHLAAVAPEHLAFNTAASFTTNTNWQAYSGETTMSYFTQMAGLAFHNFASAATGIVLAIAFIRGIARRQMQTLGNFWVDFVRCCLWVLLPFCVVGALFLVSQGVVQNLKPYDTVKLVEPQQVQRVGADGKPVSTPTASPSWTQSLHKPSRRGRWPRRKSSRNGERTAADSSMPTALIPSKIRLRLRICLRCSASSRSVPASLTLSAA